MTAWTAINNLRKTRPTGERLEFTTAMSATNGLSAKSVDKNSFLIRVDSCDSPACALLARRQVVKTLLFPNLLCASLCSLWLKLFSFFNHSAVNHSANNSFILLK